MNTITTCNICGRQVGYPDPGEWYKFGNYKIVIREVVSDMIVYVYVSDPTHEYQISKDRWLNAHEQIELLTL